MEWKEISGFHVSRCGHVLCKKDKLPFLPCIVSAGYRIVKLKQKSLKVHTLIATAFLGPPPTPQHTVDHINKDRADNRVENLRWASKQEQRQNQSAQPKNPAGSYPIQYRKVGSGLPWNDAPSMQELVRTHRMDQGSISKCIAKRKKSYRGFEFRTAPEEKIEGEEWKPLPIGEISNMGRVRMGRVGNKKSPAYYPKIRKGMEYPMYAGKMVHRLVALAFIGPEPSPGMTVDHIDRDKSNNKVTNLRWATRVEQRKNQERVSKELWHSRPVVGRIAGELKRFESTEEAARATGIVASNITACVRGRRVRAGGISWAFA